MPNFFLKHKKFILRLVLIFLVSSLGIFILGAGEARAVIENVPIPVIGHILGIIFWIITWILGKMLYMAAQLADAILGIAQFTKVGIVVIGWEIARDVANMLFVVGLLIIAGATALNLETYGAKKLLPKLIIAALLINFSLVIAGVIIDFTQVLTNFFITESVGGKGVSETIMKGLQVHTLYQQDSSILTKIIKMAAGPSIAQLAESFFAIIILITAVFTFAAFGFLLIIRIVILWILLILAPVAWLMWVLPATEHLFSKWWSSFLKWAFFAPVYAFFLHVALVSIQKGVIANEVVKGVELTGGAVFSSVFASNPQIILQYIFIILLLLGGLVAAQNMSIYGAKGAIGIAKGVGGKVSGVTAVQKRWKARKAVKEGEVKERVKRKMQLRRVGGGVGSVGQMARERLRPTAAGKAEARAKKGEVIKEEAKRIGKTMNQNEALKMAGKRIPLTSAGRAQKLAAQSLLANPMSDEYQQMMDRSAPLSPNTRKYNKTIKLANRVNTKISTTKIQRRIKKYS